MRKIEFSELRLKKIDNEETFYQSYLKNLPNNINIDNTLYNPVKQYEIFYLNILGGKLILLNKNYINSKEIDNSDLFFDDSMALKVYNLMLDIVNGIEDEKNEFNELYKNERLQKNEEIEKLKKEDEKLFQKKQDEYNFIINLDIYKNYSKIKEENEHLKLENERLREEIKSISIEQNNNVGFFQRLINRFKNKRLPKN